jgi:hypothetical protein
MKYTPSFRIALLASMASTGVALHRPGPASLVEIPLYRQQQQCQPDDSLVSRASSLQQGLLDVDREGNLYYVASRETASEKAAVPQRRQQRRDSVPRALALRGGDLSVDNEGNLYTPRGRATKPAPTAISSRGRSAHSASSKTDGLRGGSHNHNLGRLSVDSEGNLYATPPSSLSSSGTSNYKSPLWRTTTP